MVESNISDRVHIMTQQQHDELIRAALAARQRAYAPYSNFKVGAALLTESGAICAGCNVENASYGLAICAERSAVAGAISAGHRRFTALVVATSGGATPCGACRQVLAEFCDDLPILLVDADDPGIVREVYLASLLPEQFRRRDVPPG